MRDGAICLVPAGDPLSAISYKRFRKNPEQVLEDVIETDEAVTITRDDGRDVVIIPAKEFAAWRETVHLLGNKKNAARLRSAMQEPQPLKPTLKGYWSRRITKEHRLVYRIEAGVIYIAQRRYHYD